MSIARIVVRKLHIDDLGRLSDLFSEHMFHIKPDRLIDRSTPQRLTKHLHFHYILNVPLSLFGLDTFIGSVAQAGEENIVGAIIARRFPLGKSWVIGPVVVHPKFRGSGIATRMMNFTVEHLRRKKAKWTVLSVETSNIQARRFFEKSDFEYLEPVFMNHDQARKYVQMFTLISGYLQNTTCKIEQYPPQTKIAFQGDSDQKLRTNGTRTWRIMLREL